MSKLRVLDLFSGIGGFSLGLERTGGFETVAFCEIEPFCRRVLAKHWPEVPCYDDVRTLTAERLAADGIAVDVICGGFPCQDISTAGKQIGISGERSGLWSEIARLSGELRPRVLIVENVAALLGNGLDVVLGDLAALGFDAEWHCIPASAVGAPHRRDRVWLVANACGGRLRSAIKGQVQQPRGTKAFCPGQDLADTQSERCGEAREHRERSEERFAGSRALLAHAISVGWGQDVIDVHEEASGGPQARQSPGGYPGGARHWFVEPDVGRVAHGVPSRVDRLRALGNAVVPQIPELIGRAILASLQTKQEAA